MTSESAAGGAGKSLVFPGVLSIIPGINLLSSGFAMVMIGSALKRLSTAESS